MNAFLYAQFKIFIYSLVLFLLFLVRFLSLVRIKDLSNWMTYIRLYLLGVY